MQASSIASLLSSLSASSKQEDTGDTNSLFKDILTEIGKAQKNLTQEKDYSKQTQISPATATEDAIAKLDRYIKMSPFERYRELWLERHKLDSKSYAALPPEEQKKIELQIKEDFKKAVENGSFMA